MSTHGEAAKLVNVDRPRLNRKKPPIAERVLATIVEFQGQHGRAPVPKEIGRIMRLGHGPVWRGLDQLRKTGRIRLRYDIEQSSGPEAR